MKRPTREVLCGMSPSEFKTFLKRRGHKVSRDFFNMGSVSYCNGRAYRFRWWATGTVVDVSCPLEQFDRWANSINEIVLLETWIEK